MQNSDKTVAAATTSATLGGVDVQEVTTHQEALPLPYLNGSRKIVGRYVGEIYNQRAIERFVKTGGGKK